MSAEPALDRDAIEAAAAAFYKLVTDYVQMDAADPLRPAWEDVNAAQQRFIDAIPGLRDKLERDRPSLLHPTKL